MRRHSTRFPGLRQTAQRPFPFVWRLVLAACITMCATASFATPMTSPAPMRPASQPIVPPAPDLDAKSYVLMEADSGKLLANKAAHTRMAPASLTKLTTLYLVFSALKNNQITEDTPVTISKHAWKTGGSRMFVRVGTKVPVKELIQGVVVDSGNDAVVALAEYLGGTESTFVQMMNQLAVSLGMKDSHYIDPTGLPDEQHYSSAYDIALISRAIIRDFPDYYHQFFAQKWYTYNKIKQPNRNRLLWRDAWVDGLKTGHTESAGYCLAASGIQNGMRLIAVSMGTPSEAARNADDQALLTYGFRFYQKHRIYQAGQMLSYANVWLGKEKTVPVGLDHTLSIVIPRGAYKNVAIDAKLNDALKAPIKKGSQVGVLTVRVNNQTVATQPIVALKDNALGGWWTRLMGHLKLFFHKVF